MCFRVWKTEITQSNRLGVYQRFTPLRISFYLFQFLSNFAKSTLLVHLYDGYPVLYTTGSMKRGFSGGHREVSRWLF